MPVSYTKGRYHASRHREVISSLYFTEEEADLSGASGADAHQPAGILLLAVQGEVSWNAAGRMRDKTYLSKRQRQSEALEGADELYDGDVFYYTCIGEKEELMPLYEIFSGDRSSLHHSAGTVREYWCESCPEGTKTEASRH